MAASYALNEYKRCSEHYPPAPELSEALHLQSSGLSM